MSGFGNSLLFLVLGAIGISLAAGAEESSEVEAQGSPRMMMSSRPTYSDRMMSSNQTRRRSADIVDAAIETKDLSTLVAAVKAAGLVDTLKSRGPFTVFAPTNAAFARLPPGTLATLLKPANKATLTSILTYHVVPGRINASDVLAAIEEGGGRAILTTVNGETVIATLVGGKVFLTDSKGGMSQVIKADLNQSNGVVHVIDRVLMP